LRTLEHGEERLRVLIDWRDPMVKRTFVLMVPVTLGLGLINVNAVIDQVFASRLVNGILAPTAIQKSFLVYMLPQGVFAVAITTVLFPTLSRLAARGDLAGFRTTISSGLRQLAFLLIPASAVTAVLAEPIIRILFQRGQWAPYQTPIVADCLAAFTVGLFFNGIMLLFGRGFFSLQLNWIPTTIALGDLGLNAILDASFYRFGTWGIPLATAVVNMAGAAAMLYVMRRRVGSLDGRRTLSAVARVAAASAVVAGLAYLVWEPLDSSLGRSFPGQLVSLGAALVVAVAAYLGLCRIFRVEELGVLRGLVRSRERDA
jgi:putative peptidoglycan lipid II flippase